MRGDIALDVGAVADDDLYGLDVADHAAEDLCRAFTNDIAGDEHAGTAAVASGQLQGHETLTAAVTVSNEKVGLMATIYSKIEL
jgi:hypothetical protein